jgi:hypothetical protein
VDPRLVVVASEAGPNEIRWLHLNEALDLRVAYEPFRYKPWRIEAYRGGAIAISESNDGLSRMIASCSKQLGPNVTMRLPTGISVLGSPNVVWRHLMEHTPYLGHVLIRAWCR